jgi:hypothetical protein
MRREIFCVVRYSYKFLYEPIKTAVRTLTKKKVNKASLVSLEGSSSAF